MNVFRKRIAGDVVDTYEDGNEHTFLDEIIEKNGNYWEPKIKKYEDSICTKAIENLGTIELVFTKEENKRIKNAKKDIMMATLLGIARTYQFLITIIAQTLLLILHLICVRDAL